MWIFAGVVTMLVLAVVWRRRHPSPYPPGLAFLLNVRVPGLRPRPSLLAEHLVLEPGMRVLEIGPGIGVYTQAMMDRQPRARLICVDVQPLMLHKLRRRLGANAADLVCADASALPFRDRSFERLLLVSVLGEVPQRARALGECGRLVSHDGAVFVAESVIDADYIAPGTLIRDARDADLLAVHRAGSWLSYTQRLRPRSRARA